MGAGGGPTRHTQDMDFPQLVKERDMTEPPRDFMDFLTNHWPHLVAQQHRHDRFSVGVIAARLRSHVRRLAWSSVAMSVLT